MAQNAIKRAFMAISGSCGSKWLDLSGYWLDLGGIHPGWSVGAIWTRPNCPLHLSMDKQTVHCIFGVMYMHFWYAMHRQLCWCLVGVITIVQCIFGALFLGLGCNIFLVLRLWCYALSAISRRLATAVAHLLYIL